MEFSNTYARLPDAFHRKATPQNVRAPSLFLWNPALAQSLRIDPSASAQTLAELFSGNRLPDGAQPIALAYAGHQFGNFVPQLGDGRAHLLGELVDRDGARWDLQLKGSGATYFSRGGDGRCGMGPAIREFLMSEAMHALGVPTTRALAVVSTGETIYREYPQPGAVVTRVAASHLRVGTFEYFAARKNVEALRQLADYAIERHYPHLKDSKENRYLSLLDAVIEAQVKLIVAWMRIGFIHGVMNTDNTTISGQTIDYGPCAMMSVYDPKTVFSSIDRHGRYAYGNQPTIAGWNMARLAEALLPLIDEDERAAAEKAGFHLQALPNRYEAQWTLMMKKKLGLRAEEPDDRSLIDALLQIMKRDRMDYTQTFDSLTRALSEPATATRMEASLGAWWSRWQKRQAMESREPGDRQALMRSQNPVVIPRNHHIEAVIEASIDSEDPASAKRLWEVLKTPYQAGPDTAKYQDAPTDGDAGYRTFCGT